MCCKTFEKPKALLLDLDGTLINSEKAFFRSFQNVLRHRYGVDITMELYKRYELEQNAMLLKILKQQQDSLKRVSEQEIMTYIYADYESSFKQVIIEKEALENFSLLKQIKSKGVRLALVTTCRRHYIDILIQTLQLEGLFEIIIAREDVTNLKPAPDAYLKVLTRMKLEYQDCLALEDSKRGIDAALNANLPTIKVENLTSLKYADDRVSEYYSATDVLKSILQS